MFTPSPVLQEKINKLREHFLSGAEKVTNLASELRIDLIRKRIELLKELVGWSGGILAIGIPLATQSKAPTNYLLLRAGAIMLFVVLVLGFFLYSYLLTQNSKRVNDEVRRQKSIVKEALGLLKDAERQPDNSEQTAWEMYATARAKLDEASTQPNQAYCVEKYLIPMVHVFFIAGVVLFGFSVLINNK